MRLPYDLIVLDIEANQPSSKIIELGAVKFLRDGGISPNKFSQLVAIDEKLGFCTGNNNCSITELTGITDKMLEENGWPFAMAGKAFKNWVFSDTKNIVLASWGNWDIPCLRMNYEQAGVPYPFRGKSLDIKSIGVWVNLIRGKKVKADGLSSMMKAWEIPFEGTKHRACDDAYNTARLLQKWWQSFDEEAAKALKALGKLGIK